MAEGNKRRAGQRQVIPVIRSIRDCDGVSDKGWRRTRLLECHIISLNEQFSTRDNLRIRSKGKAHCQRVLRSAFSTNDADVVTGDAMNGHVTGLMDGDVAQF